MTEFFQPDFSLNNSRRKIKGTVQTFVSPEVTYFTLYRKFYIETFLYLIQELSPLHMTCDNMG